MLNKTISYRLLATTVLLLCAGSFSAAAQSSASGFLSLDSLSVAPAAGTISWSAWNLNALSTTLNSDGAVSQSFDFSETTVASASASVPYAAASVFALAPLSGTTGISGLANGEVVIPAALNESASVSGGNGNFSSLEATFTLSQATTVSLSAVIESAQASATDAGGQVLENEVIFSLLVDFPLTPTLFYDSPLAHLGPNSSASAGGLQPLAGTLSLDAGPHDLFIEVDDEQQVLETTAPDYANTFLLLVAAVGSLAAVRAVVERESSAARRS